MDTQETIKIKSLKDYEIEVCQEHNFENMSSVIGFDKVYPQLETYHKIKLEAIRRYEKDIKESITSLINVAPHKKAIEDYTLFKYKENYPNDNGGISYYTGFEILSETTLQVNYSYRGGDRLFHRNFVVDLNTEHKILSVEDVFNSLLEVANEKKLVIFTFKHDDKLYMAKWDKVKWDYQGIPNPIN